MRLLPAPLQFSIIAIFVITFLNGLVVFEPNTSNFSNFSQPVQFLTLEILSFLQVIGISCFHYLLWLGCFKLKTPTAIVNFPTASYYILVIVIFIMDIEARREFQGRVSFDQVLAYLIGVPSVYPPKLYEVGAKAKSQSLQILVAAMQREPLHWGLLIGSLGLCCVLVIVAIIVLRKALLATFVTPVKRQEMNYVDVEQVRTVTALDQNITIEMQTGIVGEIATSDQIWPSIDIFVGIRQENKVKVQHQFAQIIIPKSAIIVWIALAFADLLLFVAAVANKNLFNQFDEAMPPMWHLFKSANSQIYSLSLNEYEAAVSQFRELNQLQPGQFWLDVQKPPVYPLMRGNEVQFCVVNPELCINQKILKLPKTAAKTPPNIVMFFFESFSPLPKYANPDLIKAIEQNTTLPAHPYDDRYLPNLNKLAALGTTLLGSSSHGLPTINAWQQLMTGEYGLPYGLPMVANRKHSADIFQKRFKDAGYFTSYISPSPLEFDGKQNWVYRNGVFDEVHYSFPTDSMMKQLLLFENYKVSSWIPDRIVGRQAVNLLRRQMVHQNFSNQYNYNRIFADISHNYTLTTLDSSFFRNANQNNLTSEAKSGQPLFLTYMNVDSHTPFEGFDLKQNYVNFIVNESDNYGNILRSADHYAIGQVLDFLQATNNHTIFVVVGDHGAREASISKNSGNCGKFGGDLMFTTSSVIAYLGDDVKIKQMFSNVERLSLQRRNHDDVFESLADLMQRATSMQLNPTSRMGQSIFSDSVSQQQVSFTQVNYEYSYQNLLAKGNLYDPLTDGIISKNHIYPSCHQLKQVGYDQSYISQMYNFMKLNNFLSNQNKIFKTNFLQVEELLSYQHSHIVYQLILFVSVIIFIPLIVAGSLIQLKHSSNNMKQLMKLL